ncbi:MAG TPA: 3-hydroxyacyl-CoA dehydrogenase family protein, partial [Anaerolineales bacterium]
MKYKIHRAVVIGAGTMGAAIAAHLANTGVPVTLLDIVPNKLLPEEEQKGLTLQDRQVRNRIVQQGLDRALKSRPASFMASDLASLVSVGNLEDDFDVIRKADWVIEVIVENLKVKRELMERIDAVRTMDSIVSTNTSGIPVASIAEGRSLGFRQHFLGTHFFNPPRYLKLLEIIPTSDTLPEVVDVISRFAEYRLGKGVVLAKDTPNFIGNRLASVDGAFSMDYILEHGYTVDEVDAITGPAMGRPKTATFRLLDLVGIDVWAHVSGNLTGAIPNDERALRYLNAQPGNLLIKTMVERGWLGNKTKQGFYKEVKQDGKKEFWSLNLQTKEYEPPVKPRFDSLRKTKDAEGVGERLKILLAADDRAGELARAIVYHDLAYASACIPEIADTPRPIDDAIRWGFSHEAGPFEAWDQLGVAETLTAIQTAGFSPASWVKEMLESGHPTFYQYSGDRKIGVYHPARREYDPIEETTRRIVLSDVAATGK